jgi:hypothetical protein
VARSVSLPRDDRRSLSGISGQEQPSASTISVENDPKQTSATKQKAPNDSGAFIETVRLFGHLVLDDADDSREDCTADATAHRLAGESAYIDCARVLGKQRN